MKNDELLKLGAVTVVGVILVPIVVNTGISVINVTTSFVQYLGNKHAYNKKIKKGLKDGSIVLIDGKYYEIEKTVEEA